MQNLDVPLPPAGLAHSERFGQILEALKHRARPALLIFDTYEHAGAVQDWVEKQLLPGLIRAAWMRVVIAGQDVPPSAGTLWLRRRAPDPAGVSASRGMVRFQPVLQA